MTTFLISPDRKISVPNFEFQALDVKVRLALAIMYKACIDTPDEEYVLPTPDTDYDANLAFWAQVSSFWKENFKDFSNDKIMEIYKISKRNGLSFDDIDRKIDAKSIINSTKYFHSSGVYEYELKVAQDWKRNTKVARYALLVGGMLLGVQLPAGDA